MDSGEEYEVDRIVDKCISKRRGRVLYLVQWKGYNEAYSSWEPEENLVNCANLITEFNRQYDAAESRNEETNEMDVTSTGEVSVINSVDLSEQDPISFASPLNSVEDTNTNPVSSTNERNNFEPRRCSSIRTVVDFSNPNNSRDTEDVTNEENPTSDSEFSIDELTDDEAFTLRKADGKFENGYIPEKVIGAVNICQSIKFLVKWKGRLECDLISSKKARAKCPQLILDYYERNIQWNG